MAWIGYDTERFIKDAFKDRWLRSNLYRIWQHNRYIQIRTPIKDENVHYEAVNGRVELHFECDDYESKYGNLIEFLMEQTQSAQEYEWSSWNNGEWFRCSFIGIVSQDEYNSSISNFVAKFDELIDSFLTHENANSQISIAISKGLLHLKDSVEMLHMELREVLGLPLNIPDYQRAYCWDEVTVNCLLGDLSDHFESGVSANYRLGCIILHSHDGVYDIIDGQQRLVTLALLCNALNVACALLDAKIESSESLSYIAYNKTVVARFCQRLRNNRASFSNSILNKVNFSVLILQNSSLDLAYTFFSHQNSRGVGLTYYDLLKAHHLRHIPGNFPRQSYRAAEVWNKMMEAGHLKKTEGYVGIPDYVTVLDSYLFNLRHWMMHSPGGDDGTANRIKHEYEAAPTIDEIPPFGERFYFNEPIQGGCHFFEWVQRNVNLYDTFSKHPIIIGLRNKLTYGSDVHYRMVLEALLFGYYIKFGFTYIAEAFLGFLRIVVEHRYKNKRVVAASVLDYISHLNLIQSIDQATSPTFVLARCRDMAKNLSYPRRKDMRPIQIAMRNKAEHLSRDLSVLVQIESFKTLNV